MAWSRRWRSFKDPQVQKAFGLTLRISLIVVVVTGDIRHSRGLDVGA